MSLQDASLKRCFDDLAQIDADLRALEETGSARPAAPPPRMSLLMRACCLTLRQQRETVLVRLQIGIGYPHRRQAGTAKH